MEKVKLVIFDMDGLIFDSEQIYYRSMRTVLEKYGHSFSLDQFKHLIGLGEEASKRMFHQFYGDGLPYEQIFAEFDDVFSFIVREEGVPLKPGVRELLDVLEERGIRKCVGSSSSREVVDFFLDRAGLTDRFDFLIAGDEVEEAKPAPDIFLKACRKGNVLPENALVLEDSYNGLIAACRAGIPCIMVPDLIEPNKEMKERAMKICDSLHDVAQLFQLQFQNPDLSGTCG